MCHSTCLMNDFYMQVTHWPKSDYGKFYDGDSYIVLNTYRKDPSSEVYTCAEYVENKHNTGPIKEYPRG